MLWEIAHLVRHGHRPVWRPEPISDFLTWDVCSICHPPHVAITPDLMGFEPRNDFQIFRDTFENVDAAITVKLPADSTVRIWDP